MRADTTTTTAWTSSPSSDEGAGPEPEPGTTGEGQGPGDGAAFDAAVSGPTHRLAEGVAWATLLVALVPLVVAAARAIRQGWVPVGDSAHIAIRSNDVLGGGEMPLLGMWASSSWSVGFNFNHPGPLLFDALAVPAALFPGGTGQVLGATLVNVAAIVGIFLVARRCGGPYVAAVAMFEATALCWALGSAVLVEPWHATSVLLPFLAFLLLVWGMASGDVPLLPWAVGVGSFVLATNLSYSVLVPLLMVFGVGAGILVRRRAGGEMGSPLPGRTIVLSVVVLFLAWAQPLYEQFFGDQGEGNLTRLVRSLGETTSTLNLSQSLRTVAKVVCLPPWWLRPSYAEAFPFGPFGNPLPALLIAVAALLVLASQLGYFSWLSHRAGDRRSLAALVTAAVVVLAALVTANQTPTSLAFGTVAYQLRWLWPLGAFVTFALGITFVRQLVASRPDLIRWVVAWVGIGPVLMAALNLPASHQATTAPEATLPVARDLVRQVAAAADGDDGDPAELEGRFLMQCDEGIYDPYCEAVMAELQRRDVAFADGSDIGPRQLGEGRRWDGTNADALLRVVTGEFALLPRSGAERVALHEGLDEDQQLDLFYLREDIQRAVAEGRLRLNDDGRRVAARGGFEGVRPEEPGTGDAGATGGAGEPQIDAAAILEPRWGPFGEHRRDLVAMVREDLLDVDGELADQLERYVDLQEAMDVETVAVFVEPIPTTQVPFPPD